MRLIKVKDYEEMSQLGAAYLLSYLMNKGRQNIAITAGNTPKKMYEIITPIIKDNKSFTNIHYYNFDEVPFKDSDAEGITMSGLRQLYFGPANITPSNIHVLGTNNYLTFDEEVEKDGGLDLIVMGLGADGHFCGNMPDTTTFDDATVRVDLNLEMREELSKEFGGSIEDVPTFYVTMGPRSVMDAKTLLLIVNGKSKALALKNILAKKLDPKFPSTILSLHPNLTIIADEEALSLSK